jgi:hypothetical protein
MGGNGSARFGLARLEPVLVSPVKPRQAEPLNRLSSARLDLALKDFVSLLALHQQKKHI